MRVPRKSTAVCLARMVMPFSRSRSIESMTRSTTSWLARNAPDWRSIASTRVVLPWSTCATIARLRRSSLIAGTLVPFHVEWSTPDGSNGALAIVLVLVALEAPADAAEAHRVRDRHVEAGLPALQGYVVEVAFGVRVLEVDGGRKDLVAQGERGDDRLQRAGGAEQVAGHRLGRGGGERVGVGAERLPDRLRLRRVA